MNNFHVDQEACVVISEHFKYIMFQKLSPTIETNRNKSYSTVLKLVIIGCSVAYCLAQSPGTNNEWTLRLLHTNDMHARFSQTSVTSTECLPKQAKAGECYGGFARIATLVRKARNSTVTTIYLNAGDTYTGTKWFTAHKWRIVSKFLNILQPDVMSLGNHEFDEGVEGLIPFIDAATFPIVTANLDLKNEPWLAATKLTKNVIIDTNDGHGIGVIGYLTPETKLISRTGKVVFLDEVTSVRKEVESLRAEGIKIIIALGHSGFEVDKKIAAEVDGLDLVIGAHDNTFLYNGPKPDREDPIGPYPTAVIGVGGRKVYVAQAYAYTKYLGDLTINFDGDGEITRISGNPVLVDNSIPKAPDVLKALRKWRPAVKKLSRRTVGSTKVLLDGSRGNCRKGECILGNLIVDAMIDYNVREYGGDERWTDAAIALQISGTIQGSIEKSSNNKITMGNINNVLPYSNGLVKLDLNGSLIHQMLEHSVDRLIISDPADPSGAFLHFSGLQVVYDLSKPKGSRLVSALARCAECEVPIFEELVQNKTYKVLTMDFVANGGEGYSMISRIKSDSMGVSINQVLINYLSEHSPVYPEVEGRIKFLDTEFKNDKTATAKLKGRQ